MSHAGLGLNELLSNYRLSTLQTMLLRLGLATDGKREAVVEILVERFKAPEYGATVLDDLDEPARAVLDLIRSIGGAVSRESLDAVVVDIGLATAAETVKDYYNPHMKGRVDRPRSIALQDVLARLEVRGVLLGEVSLNRGATVLDFGVSTRYIVPPEVEGNLPPPPPRGERYAAAEPPAGFTAGDTGAFRRGLYSVWSYIWRNEPKLLKAGTIGKRDLKVLAGEHPLPLDVAAADTEVDLTDLHFQRKLLEALELIHESRGALKVDIPNAEEFWSQPIGRQAERWFSAWKDGEWWLELIDLPDVSWSRPGGAEPMRIAARRVAAARRPVVQVLMSMVTTDTWLPLSEALARLRLAAPEFLIPEVRSTYGYTRAGNSFYGSRYSSYNNPFGWSFDPVRGNADGWSKVEGGFVRRVAETMHAMGLLDIGSTADDFVVRATSLGAHVLFDAPPPEEPDGGRIVLQPDFHVVAFGPVGENRLLRLERFTDRASTDKALEFVLTRDSVYRGQLVGMDGEEIVAELRDLTGAEIPQNVMRTLEDWQASHERIVIRRAATLLQAIDPGTLDALGAKDERGAALRRLAPTIALVQDGAAVSAALTSADLSPIRVHRPDGRDSLSLDEEGVVSPRAGVVDIYALGTLQRLAEWDEQAGVWRLTPAGSRRAERIDGLDADDQVAAWHRLVHGDPPGWIERRIKSWLGAYGSARAHDVLLIELRDDDSLSALRAHAESQGLPAPTLERFAPTGVLVKVNPEEMEAVRALLDAHGIAFKGEDEP